MTATSQNSNENLVIFKVGPVPCCVDSQHVLAVIEPPTHITAIPGSNAFRPGLFSYQKRAVAVYDVRTKFSLSTEQRGKIMLAEINRQLFGFWVDQIQQIALTSQGRMQILPAECPKELFESLFILNDQLIFKTSFEALSKAQVSTRAQQFIQQYVKEKTEQRQSAHEISVESSSQKSRETAKKQQPLPAENKTTKAVKKPLVIDSLNTLKASTSETGKTATHHKAIKPPSDDLLSQVSKTADTLTKTKTAATEFRKKDSQTTTAQSDVNANYTRPVSPGSKQVGLSQQKNNINVQKTNTKNTDSPKISNTKESSTRSSELKPETQTKRESSHAASSLNKANTTINKTITPRESDIQSTHSYSTQKTLAAKETPPSHEDENNSSNWAVAFFIIILLLPAAYFGWELVQTPETKSSYRPLKHNQQQIIVTNKEEILIEKVEEPNVNNIIADAENLLGKNTVSLPNTNSQNSIEESITDQTSSSVTVSDEVTNEISDNFSIETEPASEYQADIEKHDDDITITLSGPDVEFNTTETKAILIETPEIITEQEDSDIQIPSELEEDVEKDTNSETPAESVIVISDNSNKVTTSKSKLTSKKIIHIVVKGDTLWHIAKRYVRNPFKYNELARLSNIKNPDLIYPGNRVIILIKKNKQ